MRRPISILDLPNELDDLKYPDFDLSLSDLQNARLQSRTLKASAEATLKEASAGAVVNDTTSGASTTERIAKLRRREAGFANFNGSEIDIKTLGHVNRPGGGISSDC
jgi:hypothetical protein